MRMELWLQENLLRDVSCVLATLQDAAVAANRIVTRDIHTTDMLNARVTPALSVTSLCIYNCITQLMQK